MRTPNNPQLRQAIIAEMKRRKADDIAQLPSLYAYLDNEHEYCTWWFKFKINEPTKLIRRELERMADEGLVVRSERSTSNNTRWILAENAGEQNEMSREA